MTAEVAIINPSAVALAADSAVTIKGGKIYNSALKLFALSKTEPVGIMIYGNATLMNVPWETIIKIFRKELGTESYKNLVEYSDAFFEFLTSKDKGIDFFPEEVEKIWFEDNTRRYFKNIEEDTRERIPLILKNTGINESDEKSMKRIIFELDKIINDKYLKLKEKPRFNGMSKRLEDELQKKYSENIQSIRKNVFKKIPLSPETIVKLDKSVVMLHSRNVFFNSKSGIVIAGFGTDDLYPSVETHEVGGVIYGLVKKKRLDSHSKKIQQGSDSEIIPFAQSDMVDLFMKGIDNSVYLSIKTYLLQMLGRLQELMNLDQIEGEQKLKDNLIKEYQKNVQLLSDEFLKIVQVYINKKQVQPIIEIVNVLPKDELAAMAETLVNLTAFKRKMTNTLETVGGPVDVAVISKGDGLVWVKRKHYFPKELNQHFFANYYREVENGKKQESEKR